MYKKLLLLVVQTSQLLILIVLSGCAAAPAPQEIWQPVSMVKTVPTYFAKKIYFIIDVSVEASEVDKEQPARVVSHWTTIANQLVKDIKEAGADADFIISIEKIDPKADVVKNIDVPLDATHAVILSEARTETRGQVVVNAWWTASVYHAISKNAYYKNNYENISLYKYKFVSWGCSDTLSSKETETACYKAHSTYHINNLKKIGILLGP
jgi:hypothetical protein